MSAEKRNYDWVMRVNWPHPLSREFCTRHNQAGRFESRGNRLLLKLPCKGLVGYLPKDCWGAMDECAVGEGQYDARGDIDRYSILCYATNESGGCPCWDELRRIIAGDKRELVENARGTAIDVGAHDGNSVASGVCERDPEVVVIPERGKDVRRIPCGTLLALGANCDHANYGRGNSGYDAGNADYKCYEMFECNLEALDKQNFQERETSVHGGIIAFFKRLLGRRG